MVVVVLGCSHLQPTLVIPAVTGANHPHELHSYWSHVACTYLIVGRSKEIQRDQPSAILMVTSCEQLLVISGSTMESNPHGSERFLLRPDAKMSSIASKLWSLMLICPLASCPAIFADASLGDTPESIRNQDHFEQGNRGLTGLTTIEMNKN